MNWKDELIQEMGYTICPICFPEYTYCNEDCEHCKEYIDFKQYYEEKKNVEGGWESERYIHTVKR